MIKCAGSIFLVARDQQLVLQTAEQDVVLRKVDQNTFPEMLEALDEIKAILPEIT